MSNSINSDYLYGVLSTSNLPIKQAAMPSAAQTEEVIVSGELNKLVHAVKETVVEDEAFLQKIAQLKHSIQHRQYPIDTTKLVQKLLQCEF